MKRYAVICLLLAFLLCQGAPVALAAETIFWESDEFNAGTGETTAGTGETTAGTGETTAGTEETTADAVEAEPARTPDQCGENAYWSLSGGTLTISGTGATDDFTGGAPWGDSRGSITAVVIESGITYLGASAFENCDNLTAVDFGGDLRELGTGAFRSCDGLTEIRLPAAFRALGEECLRSCAGLKTIHFDGGMPSFRLNCLWDTYADLIFPAKNPWPLEHIIQLEESFQGRIEFLASDGTDPYVSDGEQTTEATTEPTEAETTVPTTAATMPTTAPTEATEPETTVARTEPETTQAATAQTQPEKPERNSGSGVILAVGLCAFSAGMLLLLLRGRLRSGGKYSR